MDSNETAPEVKAPEQEQPVASPSAPQDTPSAPQQKSSVGIMVLVALVGAIVVGAGGFVFGMNSVKKEPVKNDTPVPTRVVDKKAVTKISGVVKTDASDYNYFVVDASAYGDLKAEKHLTRVIHNPQPNVAYPFAFEGLDHNTTYTIIAKGCREKDQVTACVRSKKLVNCSGRIPTGEDLEQCLIRGDGEAEFFFEKELLSEILKTPDMSVTPTQAAVNVTPTKTP